MDASVAKSYRFRDALRSVCGGRPLDFPLREQNVLGVGDTFSVGESVQ